jgi:hypothetical protein
VKAEPFYRGLRVRSSREGECRACSLMCGDMHRMGYRDVLVDPSVRVAYNPVAFTARLRSRCTSLMTPRLPNAPPLGLVGWPTSRGTDWVDCCPLPPGKHHLDWDDPKCYGVNIMEE